MTSLIKEQVGKVLHPLLSPFHQVDGHTLLSVWEREADDEIESISFEFDSAFLTISVDGEDDTVEISVSPERTKLGDDVSHLKPWDQQIGKTFGWGWLGVNQQGYIDSVALSFGSVIPQFTITAISSALHIAQSRTVATRKTADRGKTAQAPAVALAKTA